MPLTTAGIVFLAGAAIDDSVTFFDNANAYLGAGNGNTAFNVAQTDLQGGSKARAAMDATFPTRASAVVTFQSTFGTGAANFAWEEWGVFNDPSAGTMLSRKVESLGTKTSAQSWILEAELTFQIGA